MKKVKLTTPLRYPGGKSRAVKYLFDDDNLPKRISEYREPFLGGGSCAIAFTQKYPEVPVWVNDKYYSLYCFWIVLRDHCDELQSILLEKKREAVNNNSHRVLFEYCKETITGLQIGRMTDQSMIEIAWRFYVCNKCSFSGLGESSGFSEQAAQSNFSMRGIEMLSEYSKLIQHWTITCFDYQIVLASVNDDSFVFLDPPYDIDSFLYGKNGGMHSSFDHIEFHEVVGYISCNAMITYNNNDKLRKMYEHWNQTVWDLTYTMRSDKTYRGDEANRKELLLLNYKPDVSNLENFFE